MLKNHAGMRVSLVIMVLLCGAAVGQTAPDSATVETRVMSLDVKDTEIRDVVRMISKGYDINIILDNEVSGKVTLHLSNVPILEGLRSLAASNGWSLVREGNVFRMRKSTAERRMAVRYYSGYLTIDVQNADVVEFIKEVSSVSGISIVSASALQGTVSGKLYQVPFDDGLRAILEANSYKVIKKRNIYRVEQDPVGETTDGAPRMRRNYMSGQSGGASNLNVEYSNGLVSVDVKGANLSDVISMIAERSEIEVITYGDISEIVNARLLDVALPEAFALLLGGTRFTFVQKGNIYIVGDRNPATPSGQALSKSELIHLKHTQADEVVKNLPKDIPPANVRVIKEQNALLVSGTSEDIVLAREFLNTIDIPTPQVILDVIVVEYTRDLTRDMGFEFGYDSEGKRGSNSYGLDLNQPSTASNAVSVNRRGVTIREPLNPLSEIFGWNWVTRIPDNFFASLRLLESENKAKVLAQPSITVLNGNKASIRVGQTQYFRIVAGTSDNPTYRFEPISFGINLDITPWISLSGQITAEISPEISNMMGSNDEGYPNIFKRSVSTTVRLEDGQTLILGGLLRSEEQASHKKVPILGDLPVIGNLFKNFRKGKVQTNLVIYITPHIVETGKPVDLHKELDQFKLNEERGFKRNFFDSFENGATEPVQKKSKIRSRSRDDGTAGNNDTLPAAVQPAIEPSGTSTESVPSSGAAPQ